MSREPVEILPFGDVVVRVARMWPDRVAVAFPDRRLTASELLDELPKTPAGKIDRKTLRDRVT